MALLVLASPAGCVLISVQITEKQRAREKSREQKFLPVRTSLYALVRFHRQVTQLNSAVSEAGKSQGIKWQMCGTHIWPSEWLGWSSGREPRGCSGRWPGRVNKRTGPLLQSSLSSDFSVEKAQTPVCPSRLRKKIILQAMMLLIQECIDLSREIGKRKLDLCYFRMQKWEYHERQFTELMCIISKCQNM